MKSTVIVRYVHEDAGAIAAKAMARAGVKFHPGEQIGYLILGIKRPRSRGIAPGPQYCLQGTRAMIGGLLRGAETLLSPLGYPAERIQSWLDTS